MSNKVYDSGHIVLVDGTEIFISPLKIKYLREFMESFDKLGDASNEDETLDVLLDCTRIAMKQYYSKLKTVEEVEENIDIKSMYKILEIGAGIKMNDDGEDQTQNAATKASDGKPPSKWSDIDLVTLESEVFLLGIWKDYDDLESSLSMQELTVTLNAKRESDYREKKFLAAIQGVDLDKQTGKQNEWEEMKARVFSGGKAKDANDITALQGINAQKAGFGIGMGLGYEDLTKK
jgi:hypothetical protein